MAVKLNAKFVKQMLIEREMDQKGLAEKSGLSEITISRLMKGSRFNSETLAKIADALGCHPVDLISERAGLQHLRAISDKCPANADIQRLVAQAALEAAQRLGQLQELLHYKDSGKDSNGDKNGDAST